MTTPVVTPPVNEAIEYVKVGFAFGGALLGSILGTPLIEWFKDRLGASRQWKTQRNEIVGTIRLIAGILAAFNEHRIAAFGHSWDRVKYSERGFERLLAFDFALFNDSLAKLSALQPEDSARSAVAQRLIQHLVVLKGYFQQLQAIQAISITRIPDKSTYLGLSEEDVSLLKESDGKYTDFQRFLCGIYARRLGIDALSLAVDHEIVKFERAMHDHDLQQSMDEGQRLLKQLETMRAKDASQVTPLK